MRRVLPAWGNPALARPTKLCNQIIVGSLLPILAEAIRLAEAGGVDAKRLPEALKGGFADSLPLQIFGARMASRTFEPSIGVPLPMVERALERYRKLESAGAIGRDPSVLVDLDQ